ncbi:phospholipase D family protein [Castellaniella sp. MT123]|uniref:phospholipase D family protein n=1 Tax=Castellaniella sp. MT123 TaxID=3140381 RepID=UPI0031F457C4
MRLSRTRFRAMMKAAGQALLHGRHHAVDRNTEEPTRRTTVPDTTDATQLARSVKPLHLSHAAQSGFVPLSNGRAAFAARVALADAAECSLDVQYYIWHDDMTGLLLFDALRRAAERGVQVRLLLDDNNTAGLDTIIAGLNAHPNIEVRLFNVFTVRRWRALGYLTDFSRLNRRMHNKSFTADRQVAIVGGRNIGDEYFEAGNNALFIDLDILAIGPVVGDVAEDFERYWTSDSSRPAEQIVRKPHAEAIAAFSSIGDQEAGKPYASAYTEAIFQEAFVHDLLTGRLRFEWANVSLVSDNPDKGLDKAPRHTLLWPRLQTILGGPTTELELVSPYLVPAGAGVDAFAALVKKGVKVTLLTNSLEATDVVAVHAGYAKRRRPLLAAGATLFELKRMASIPKIRDRGLTGGSGSSLHAKVFSIDRQRVFIGSFNFDPRSRKLNTEMGFVIESPDLAGQIADNLDRLLASHAYEVRIGGNGKLEWVEQVDSATVVRHHEPGATFWRRAGVAVAALLPIDWLL